MASDPKKAAEAILESTGLDPDQYRLGHTKACYVPIRERSHPILEAYLASDSSIVHNTRSAPSFYIVIALIQLEKLKILLKFY